MHGRPHPHAGRPRDRVGRDPPAVDEHHLGRRDLRDADAGEHLDADPCEAFAGVVAARLAERRQEPVAGLDQHEKEQWANARRVGDVYNEPGGKFGMVRFDWGDDPTVHLEVRDRKGEVVIAKSLARSELRQ